MKIIANWIELAQVPDSEKYSLDITPEDGNGWIREKEKPDKCGEYLSTHTFYGNTHEYSTKLLQSCGFDVVLANWDEPVTQK